MLAVPSGITSGTGIFLSKAIAVSRKIRLPQTIGVPHPLPATGTFQLMFSVLLQVIGGSACGATPFHVGPLHCGQNICSSFAEIFPENNCAKTKVAIVVSRRCFICLLLFILRPSLRRRSAVLHSRLYTGLNYAKRMFIFPSERFRLRGSGYVSTFVWGRVWQIFLGLSRQGIS